MTGNGDTNADHDGPSGKPPLSLRDQLELYRSFDEAQLDPQARELLAALDQDPRLHADLVAVQTADRRIAAALFQVAVPAGLADRLLDAVAEDATVTLPSSPQESPAEDRPSRRRFARARWWAIAATLLIAAGLAYWRPWYKPAVPWSTATLATKSASWLGQLDPGAWRSIRSGDLSEFPLPPGLAARPQRIQVATFDGRRGAVMRAVTGRRRAEVYLFAIPMENSIGLPHAPPPRPVTATNGWLVGSWQSRGFVYVIRMRGSVADYRHLIGEDVPLAMSRRVTSLTRKVT